MSSLQYEEELLSSIYLFVTTPPLPLKSGIIEPPNLVSETIDLFHTPDSSSLKTRHSPTPPATNLQVTIDNYTIPTIP